LSRTRGLHLPSRRNAAPIHQARKPKSKREHDDYTGGQKKQNTKVNDPLRTLGGRCKRKIAKEN